MITKSYLKISGLAIAISVVSGLTYLTLTAPGLEEESGNMNADPLSNKPDSRHEIVVPVVDNSENPHHDNTVASSSGTPLDDLADYKESLQMGLDYKKDHWCFLSQLDPESAAQGITESDAWATARGYTSSSVESAYSSYNTNTLEEMAKNGDVVAYTLLFKQIDPREFHDRKAEYDGLVDRYFDEASALGSTTAMNWKAIRHISQAKTAYRQGDNKAVTEEIIKALAYYEVAFLRGDYTAVSMIDYFINQVDINVDKEIIDKVDIEADKIYENMKARRRAVGLGEFDNSRPLSRERYDQMKIAMVTKKSSNPWFEKFVPSDDCMNDIVVMQDKLDAAEKYLASLR